MKRYFGKVEGLCPSGRQRIALQDDSGGRVGDFVAAELLKEGRVYLFEVGSLQDQFCRRVYLADLKS